MATNFRTFNTTPEISVAAQPWVGQPPLSSSGIFLGRDLRTKRIVRFDPWDMKRRGLIDATTFMLTGMREAGKSTWAKTVIARMMAMQAGLRPDGHPEIMRAWLHDNKREGGAGEYGKLAEFLGATTIELSRSQSVNVFDTAVGMTEWDLLEIAVNMCEMVAGEKLRDFQPLALQVGMSIMLREARDVSSLEVLEATVRSLKTDDVAAYFRASDNAVLNSFGQSLAERPELEQQLQIRLQQPHNVPEADLLHDAALVAAHLKRILSGDFGGIFGGLESFRSKLSDQTVVFDWANVNNNARTLLESVLWKIQTVALNNNDLELIPHILMGDEEHEAIKNLMHARFRSAYLRKARAYHTVDLSLTQFWTDFLDAGDAGSELRGLAEGIARSVGCHILFRQANDDKIIKYLSEQLGISDQDVAFLTSEEMQASHIVGIKTASRPITFYQHVLARSEYPLVPTNSATDRMLQRIRGSELSSNPAGPADPNDPLASASTNGHVPNPTTESLRLRM